MKLLSHSIVRGAVGTLFLVAVVSGNAWARGGRGGSGGGYRGGGYRGGYSSAARSPYMSGFRGAAGAQAYRGGAMLGGNRYMMNSFAGRYGFMGSNYANNSAMNNLGLLGGGYGGYGMGGLGGMGFPLLGMGGLGYGLGGGGFGGGGFGGGGRGGYGGGNTAASAPAATQPAANTIDFAALGENDFRSGKYSDAVKNWQHALLEDPKNGVLHLMVGQALFAVGQYEHAAGAIQAGMQLLPKDKWGTVVAHFRELYAPNQDYRQQLRELELTVKQHDSAAARFLLGYQYGYLGYPKHSVRELDQAVKLNPQDQLADSLKGMMAAKLDQAPASAGRGASSERR